VKVTLDDLNLAELRALYRTFGGTDDHYDPATLRRLISTRSCGDVPPHTPNTSGRATA
jgi:hypothetical protein